MRRNSLDLIVVNGIALIAMLLALLDGVPVVFRTVFVLPFVLVLPGYVLLAATIPQRNLDIPERLGFSIGSSMAVSILGGLILNWTPQGLKASSWVILLGSSIFLLSVIAQMRRRHIPATATVYARVGCSYRHIRHVILIGLSILIVIFAWGMARYSAIGYSRVTFTQLWLLPSEDVQSSTVQLGIYNAEVSVMRYRLVFETDHFVHTWGKIELNPGEIWQIEIVLPEEENASGLVEATLYNLDIQQGDVYRNVAVWR